MVTYTAVCYLHVPCLAQKILYLRKQTNIKAAIRTAHELRVLHLSYLFLVSGLNQTEQPCIFFMCNHWDSHQVSVVILSWTANVLLSNCCKGKLSGNSKIRNGEYGRHSLQEMSCTLMCYLWLSDLAFFTPICKNTSVYEQASKQVLSDPLGLPMLLLAWLSVYSRYLQAVYQ